MYISKVSLRNFGPFHRAAFEFSGQSINVVVGENASGKTQLCGAIVAAIVGRSAVQIREGAEAPSEVSVSLIEENSVEVATLIAKEEIPGKVSVSHIHCPLAVKILTTFSDPNGPQLILASQSELPILSKAELKALADQLPDRIKYNKRWTKLLNRNEFPDSLGSSGEQALLCLLREFTVRQNSSLKLPLIIDDIDRRWDQSTALFAAEILEEIAKSSQVIILTNSSSLLAGSRPQILTRTESRNTTLVGYNYRELNQQRRARTHRLTHKWVKGATFPRQENRYCELKEVKGKNPLGSIKSLVDQYAVAFMNAGSPQDGSIFWGVRDEDLTITGVPLDRCECDELRRIVTEKLHQIIPTIAPTAYQLELHPLSDGKQIINDLYLIEVRIPKVRRTLLFSTGSQEVYVKTDAGKRRLSALEIQQELLRRVGIEPSL